jgi:hypothetical protein
VLVYGQLLGALSNRLTYPYRSGGMDATARVHRGTWRRCCVAAGGTRAAGPIALLTSNDGDALNLNQKARCRKCADGDEGARWKAFFEYFLTNIS